MSPDPLYIHGTDPGEQQRLSRLNDLINGRSLRELELRGGERVLEVGSGLGQFARVMARAAGTAGRVVAVERNEAQVAEAIRLARLDGEESLLDLRRGDAMSLPLLDEEWASFDVAHARFLLEHVSDPASVVRAMIRSVRPGGRIVLEDDDHDVLRLWPAPRGFYDLWHAYVATYVRRGNDPYVGRRLIALLHEAGARPERCTWIFFGGASGEPTFLALVENMIGILRGARDAILETGLLDEERFGDAIEALHVWSGRSDAALWYAIAWAAGIR